MPGPVADAPERFVVLAMVTGPDEATLAAVGVPTALEARPGFAAVAVTAVAMLSFSRFSDGRLRRPMIRSVDALTTGEVDALTIVDRHLSRHYYLGARLVAFGVDAMLRTLGRRARRHWLFEEFDFPRWSGGGAAATFDAGSEWDGGTLAEACAAVGIKGAKALSEGPRTQGAVEPTAGSVPPHVRRAEAAAVATALLMAHDLSALARSPLPLLRTWSDVLSLVRSSLPRLGHCADFHCDGVVDPDIYSIVGAPVPRRQRPRQ